MEMDHWVEGKEKWGVDLTFEKTSNSSIWVEFFNVPESARGYGIGKQAWNDFERYILGKENFNVKEMELLAVDAGAGLSVPFWEKVGFFVKRKQGNGFLMAKSFLGAK